MPAVRLALCVLVSTVPAFAQCPWLTGERTDTPGGGAEEFRGFPVAVSGDHAVVGAPADATSFGGAVYVLQRAGSTWSIATKLSVPLSEPGASFGAAVAISGDRIVVGAPYESAQGFHTGAAYVFRGSGASWTQVAKLVASNAFRRDYFGSAVALDGTTALVGAYGATVLATHYHGAAYVFEETGGVWSEVQRLLPFPGGQRALFGRSVALEGGVAVVGAPYEDDPTPESGAAYVFTEVAGAWPLSAKLRPAAPEALARFGAAVAVSGPRVLVGAPHYDDPMEHFGLGFVSAFQLIGSTWVPRGELRPSDGAAGDYFGFSLDLDGSRAVIGAHGVADFGFESGAAYIYELKANVWSSIAKLHAADAALGARFGFCAALEDDVALLTAPLAAGVAPAPGALYSFDVPSPAQSYGSGCAPLGGMGPKLEILGCPSAGSPLTLRVEAGIADAPVAVIVGRARASIPLAGGCMQLVDPIVQTLALAPIGVDGSSECTLTIPFASSPGWTFTFQAFVGDPVVPQDQAASNGVEIVLQ